MKLIIKTTAAVTLTVAVIVIYGFISSVLSLSVGENAELMGISVERSGYSIYRLHSPAGSFKLNTAEADRIAMRIADVFGIYRHLIPETVTVLLGKHGC